MACGVCFFLMRRRPPRSARTDTLFPYTTLFRSQRNSKRRRLFSVRSFTLQPIILVPEHAIQKCRIAERLGLREPLQRTGDIIASEHDVDRVSLPIITIELHRSEEPRVGKECVSSCRSRWVPCIMKYTKILLP